MTGPTEEPPPECKVEATIPHVVGLVVPMLHDCSFLKRFLRSIPPEAIQRLLESGRAN